MPGPPVRRACAWVGLWGGTDGVNRRALEAWFSERVSRVSCCTRESNSGLEPEVVAVFWKDCERSESGTRVRHASQARHPGTRRTRQICLIPVHEIQLHAFFQLLNTMHPMFYVVALTQHVLKSIVPMQPWLRRNLIAVDVFHLSHDAIYLRLVQLVTTLLDVSQILDSE